MSEAVVPLYHQIYVVLRQQIVEGRFGQGPLPGEIDLAKQFHASRVTMRRVFDRLVQEGLVRRHRGLGTFVNPHPIKPVTLGDRPGSLLDNIIDMGQKTSVKVISIDDVHATPEVAEALGLQPGDPVMVEEPGWAVEFARLASLGMRVLPVPRGPDGPDLAVMQRYCESCAPKLYVSVSVLHNPTGYSLSPASAHEVLQLARRFGFYVVEDDTYGEIAPDHAARMTVLDRLSHSIYVSGFAKLLAPNWRVGYLAPPPALVERLVDTKLLEAQSDALQVSKMA